MTTTDNSTSFWKTLYRSDDRKVIAGVCAGLSERFGFNPNVLRAALAVSALFSGTGIVAYLIAWAVLPMASAGGNRIAGSRRRWASAPLLILAGLVVATAASTWNYWQLTHGHWGW